jgi:flagellar basal body-associated protein FliL
MNKKKLMIIALILLLVVGVAYKKVLAPKPIPVKKKIEGHLFQMDPEFVINLAQGRYAKVTVALLLTEAPAADGHGGGAPTLHQDAAVRSIVTDTLTGVDADHLTDKEHRKKVLIEIKEILHKKTDEHVKAVYFTDIAVQ